jgi:hypothetical protein
MKIVEIMDGLRIALSNEESFIANKVKNGEVTDVSQLSERGKQVLLTLIHKNVLNIDGRKLSFNDEEKGIW